MDGECFVGTILCDLQEVYCGMDELLWSAEVHVVSFYVLSQDFDGEIDNHFSHFVKTDGALGRGLNGSAGQN